MLINGDQQINELQSSSAHPELVGLPDDGHPVLEVPVVIGDDRFEQVEAEDGGLGPFGDFLFSIQRLVESHVPRSLFELEKWQFVDKQRFTKKISGLSGDVIVKI